MLRWQRTIRRAFRDEKCHLREAKWGCGRLMMIHDRGDAWVMAPANRTNAVRYYSYIQKRQAHTRTRLWAETETICHRRPDFGITFGWHATATAAASIFIVMKSNLNLWLSKYRRKMAFSTAVDFLQCLKWELLCHRKPSGRCLLFGQQCSMVVTFYWRRASTWCHQSISHTIYKFPAAQLAGMPLWPIDPVVCCNGKWF